MANTSRHVKTHILDLKEDIFYHMFRYFSNHEIYYVLSDVCQTIHNYSVRYLGSVDTFILLNFEHFNDDEMKFYPTKMVHISKQNNEIKSVLCEDLDFHSNWSGSTRSTNMITNYPSYSDAVFRKYRSRIYGLDLSVEICGDHFYRCYKDNKNMAHFTSFRVLSVRDKWQGSSMERKIFHPTTVAAYFISDCNFIAILNDFYESILVDINPRYYPIVNLLRHDQKIEEGRENDDNLFQRSMLSWKDFFNSPNGIQGLSVVPFSSNKLIIIGFYSDEYITSHITKHSAKIKHKNVTIMEIVEVTVPVKKGELAWKTVLPKISTSKPIPPFCEHVCFRLGNNLYITRNLCCYKYCINEETFCKTQFFLPYAISGHYSVITDLKENMAIILNRFLGRDASYSSQILVFTEKDGFKQFSLKGDKIPDTLFLNFSLFRLDK